MNASKKLPLIILWLLASVVAFGQAGFPGEYTQNFDGITTPGVYPAGWSANLGGSAGTGSSTAGGVYVYSATCCPTDRSLGGLHSGSASPVITGTFVNTSGATITSLYIYYESEQYRAGGGNTVGLNVTFNGAANAALTSTALSTPTGVFTTPVSTAKSTTITGLSIAAGATFTMTFTPGDGGGSDNGVAVDNFKMCIPGRAFSVTATSTSPITEPAPLAFTGGASAGTAPYTYSWSGPSSFTSAVGSPTISPSAVANSGTYTLTVTDNIGCTASATTTATVNPGAACSGTPTSGTPTAGTSAFCGSGSTTISVTGGTSAAGLAYQWQSSSTGGIGTFSDISGATNVSYTTPTLTTTTYYRLVTTCTSVSLSDTSTIGTITINPFPTITATPAGGSICTGGSLSMTASGAATYTWTPTAGLSATTGATVIANPTATTTYTITGTSAGCTGSTTATVTYNYGPAAVSILPSSPTLCTGDLLTVSGGAVVLPLTTSSGTLTLPSSIAALGTISTPMTISGIPADAVITGATVNLISFGTQYQDDYVINLKAPNGNILNLVNHRGAHSSAVTTIHNNTILSSTGVTPFTSGSSPFTGTWAADVAATAGASPFTSNVTSWSGLYSVPNGTWTLSLYNATTFANAFVPSAQWSITLYYSIKPITWSPATDLYTDAAGTVAYTGGISDSVYYNPTTPGIATFTATSTYGTCSTTASATYTVNASPAAITGTPSVCQGSTTALATTTAGGTWSSSNPAVGTIDVSSGIFTGIASGTATVSYMVGSGCSSTVIVTVNALPGSITGTLSVCETLTTTLNSTPAGGTWSSSTATVGTVDATSGIVTGIAAGTTDISYTSAAGCITTTTATVNTQPLAIAGLTSVCEGLTTTFTNAVTGGTWSAAPTAVGTIDATSGLFTGITAGTANVTYTLPSGCNATIVVTINALPAPITGTMTVCENSTTTLSDATTGGTWSTGDATAAIDITSGEVTGLISGTATITYTSAAGCINTAVVTANPIPAAIGGTLGVCEGLTTTLTDVAAGGTWMSSNTTTGTIDASGVVTAIVSGTTNITYTLPTGCYVSTEVTVNALPANITGTMEVCELATTSLSDVTAGGTWSTGSTATATVDPAGVVTGVAAGTTGITYTSAMGCIATDIVTINALPAPITGALGVCEGLTTTLTDATIAGTWMSSDLSVGTIDASGVVTAIAAGTTNITYTLPTGCYVSSEVTINALPAAISGTLTVCELATTTLFNTTTGGTWSTSAPATATVNTTTGVVTGVAAGTATITYTLSTGCIAIETVTVLAIPSAITGTLSVCEGLSTTLNSTPAGGDWTSSTLSVATIDIATGVLTGVIAGTSTITYTTPSTGCYVTTTATVNAIPGSIGGTLTVCENQTTTLTNAVTGGTWSSSNTATATVDAAGIVSGVVAGTSTITYQLSTGCISTDVVTVNTTPATIAGTTAVCQGLNTTLSSTTPSGTWSSSNTTVATVDAAGLVNGASAGTSNITYTLTATGCMTSTTVTVNALPATITGVMTVCELSTTTLSEITVGGTWSSSNATVAAINTSGIVTGNSAGTANITYTLATGCINTTTVTVNALPAAITGTVAVCAGQNTTLSDATATGTWSSNNTTVATIDATGVVSAVIAGTTNISYTLPTGCFVTRTVTVNALPSAISGILTVCETKTTTLTDAPTGGTWSSSNSNATIGATSGIVTGITAGTADITYTLSTGCYQSATVTVNAAPAAIAGTLAVCQSSTTTLNDATLGTWSSGSATASVDAATGVVTGASAGTAVITFFALNGCTTTTVVTVNPLPGTIIGTLAVCETAQTTLTNTGGGTWTSDNVSATINATTGVVTGVTAGTSVVTYTLPTGCSSTTIVTVNALPSTITGTATVCPGQSTTLFDATAGGTWTSGSVNATIDPATGIINGVTAGSARVTYTLATGCARTQIVTVNGLPASIGGLSGVCISSTVTLTNAVGGGTWAISNTNATVDASGVVTGVTAGTAEITYTLPTGCSTTRIQTINALPAAIGGTMNVCASSSTTLTNTGGGSWSSASGNITVGSSTGIVNGVAPGTATVTYTLSTGCRTTALVTVNILPSAYLVSGGGSYCTGDTGVHVGLANSATGINYQLFNGTTVVGTAMAGTGSALDFGLITAAGIYTISATNATTACTNNMTGSTMVSINPLVTPMVSIASPSSSLCVGITATFTSTPVNGGTTPAYQWSVNGVSAGTSSTYSYTPATGDIVSVKLTSNATCATPDTAIDTDTLSVMPSNMPTVSTTVTPSLHVCAGTNVTFTAAETFGGTSPVFTWQRNNVIVASGTTYTYAPSNGDVVRCVLLSNYACRLSDTASTGNDTLVVDSSIPPIVGISVNPGLVIAPAQTVTFVTTVAGGGSTPTYQWEVNATVMAGETNSTFVSNTINNNDVVKCTVVSSNACGLTSFNSVTMRVKTGIAGVDGSDVRFAATPNPNNGSFAVNGTWTNDEQVTLELTNMLGQVVYSKTTTVLKGALKDNITVSNELPGGIYILSANSETSTHSVRVMIEK